MGWLGILEAEPGRWRVEDHCRSPDLGKSSLRRSCVSGHSARCVRELDALQRQAGAERERAGGRGVGGKAVVRAARGGPAAGRRARPRGPCDVCGGGGPGSPPRRRAAQRGPRGEVARRGGVPRTRGGSAGAPAPGSVPQVAFSGERRRPFLRPRGGMDEGTHNPWVAGSSPAGPIPPRGQFYAPVADRRPDGRTGSRAGFAQGSARKCGVVERRPQVSPQVALRPWSTAFIARQPSAAGRTLRSPPRRPRRSSPPPPARRPSGASRTRSRSGPASSGASASAPGPAKPRPGRAASRR